MDSKALQAVRDQIDQLDADIQAMINRRAACALQVAEIKRAQSDDKLVQCYRPEREAKILQAIVQRNQGPLSADKMAYLFREIMSACLALEKPVTVAYLGPEGTFTQAAAMKHFGHSVTTVPQTGIEGVFREVESDAADFGVVPVENSAEGVVDHTLDMFVHSPLRICGEVELRIHHNVLSTATSLAAIKRVYAHWQSFAQCRQWLGRNLPQADLCAVSSNAEAAKLVMDNSEVAAIASVAASECYRLGVLARNIENEPDNTTRFLVVGHHSVPPSGNDKTSIMALAKNKPGALSALLKPLADQGLSMTRIESRPSRRSNWEYLFFLDIDGHYEDPAMRSALQCIERETVLLKILGAYPKAVL